MKKEWKDIDFNFIANPITGDLAKVTDVMAIKQALKTLILYRFYQKPFHPEIGCNVGNSLFENADRLTIHMINDNIKWVVRNYEPRVKLLNIASSFDDNNATLYISITFSINNFPNEITLDLILERL